MTGRSRTFTTVAAATLVALAGCSSAGSAEPSAQTAAGVQQTGIFEPSQLPDPCLLVGNETVGTMIEAPVSPVANDPIELDGEALLIRTCMWGDTEAGFGAIGIQIGVPDLSGRNVVANRSRAMDPALDTSLGENGKETMNLGELPTGGGRGATIYFEHNGYSLLIGQVGTDATLDSVEKLANEVMASLDA